MNRGGDVFCLGVYVDGIILSGSSDDQIIEVKDTFSQKFEIKDMGKLYHFLGISVVQEERRQTMWIGQPAYTENFLKKFEMEHCKPVSTPISAGSKLEIAKEEEECINQQKYQSAMKSLMYLSVSTRPDIAYIVGTLARFSSKPTKEHWTALKRILRYLKGNTKIWYSL